MLSVGGGLLRVPVVGGLSVVASLSVSASQGVPCYVDAEYSNNTICTKFLIVQPTLQNDKYFVQRMTSKSPELKNNPEFTLIRYISRRGTADVGNFYCLVPTSFF